ncbi:aspartate aminotransferase family protein [Candidatus Viridilinea mediisalina]|uniref:Acetylornithine aminotransferase n=1 Tax=Candidatus Viridilinea mediisalina TaxID=2024553 RepID=A0A2A6RHC6_9CHLR|nr:aspartate aminotransferase family protein [Candidatus Viridilinea mediisalina]PDW02524.1 acetylornithine aminotransferase [Candidatus Viridilinea mediisalina]
MPEQLTNDAIQAAQSYILPTYAKPERVMERGEGVYLFDTEGRCYLDYASGIAVNALGYGDPELTQVIAEQAAQLIHISNLYHNAHASTLARRLIEHSPSFAKVFFANSGAEVVEAALKFARRYARAHAGEGKTTFVAFDGAFHGRTMGALAVTAREKYREPFMPVMPGVRFANFNDVASLEATMDADVCAVILEPIQGEGGLRVAEPRFLEAARSLCDQHGALLIFDEIQCGMGRTGTLWAHEATGVRPDIMTVAKPLAAGLPIGAVLMSQAVADCIQVGDHGTTFGGNPLVTAVGATVLRRISTPAFLEHVRSVAGYLDEALRDLQAAHAPQIKALRGRGLMRGLQIDGSAAALSKAAFERGLLVATSGEDVVRLLPPLIIQPRHVDELIDTLREVL